MNSMQTSIPQFHRQRLWKHHLAKINIEYPFKKFYDESALVQTLGQLNYQASTDYGS